MKKIVAIILTGCLLVSVTACGGGGAASKEAESTAPAQESIVPDSEKNPAR